MAQQDKWQQGFTETIQNGVFCEVSEVRLEHVYGIYRGDPTKKLGGIVEGMFVVMFSAREEATSIQQFQLLRCVEIDRHVANPGGEEGDPQARVGFLFIGSFSLQPDGAMVFSGDTGKIRVETYRIYAPSRSLMDRIINGNLSGGFPMMFGAFRAVESDTRYLSNAAAVPVSLAVPDIVGKRTAMFGKTRLGKSNIVKLIMQGVTEMSISGRSVGQIVFDVNGEYANDNPQDGGTSIASVYSDRSEVYYLTPRSNNNKVRATAPRLLRFNFYERTGEVLRIMRELLPEDIASSEYVRFFIELEFPDFRQITKYDMATPIFRRGIRKIQILWSILYTAGFPCDPEFLTSLLPQEQRVRIWGSNFSQKLRETAYLAIRGSPPPPPPANFISMVVEIVTISTFAKQYPNDPNLIEQDGRSLFDSNDRVAINFLTNEVGVGPFVLSSCHQFHAPNATDFISDILNSMDNGKIVIIDLGSANERVIRYFSRTMSEAIFRRQENKFVNGALGEHFVQIYFEEAHMIFPPNSGNVIDVYSRFAKEGAKFHIGIVYSTQSPSTMNRDLLAQTENFFILHLSSRLDVEALLNVQYAFRTVTETIMRFRTPGYVHMLTFSHRFPVPVQAGLFKNRIAKQIAQ